MSFFDRRRRRVPLDPPSWDVPPGRGLVSIGTGREIEVAPPDAPPALPIPQAPHCNGQHGTTGGCDWCDALAGLVTALRHQEDRLTRIEYYLGIRRDGGAV